MEEAIRVIAAAALFMAGFGAVAIGRRLHTGWVSRSPVGHSLLERLRPGVPAVIYFWSEDCAPCRLNQKPALDRLEAALGADGVQVIAVDAVNQAEVADRWGVLTLPTTFVVDKQKAVRQVNHGVVSTEVLQQQIAAV